ncbi:hypothetical protein GCM10010358_69640 [Streptomyces minutiscleroticus]|uniref:Transposase n=2 Tax=Streptomyces minutiscleroticus TaxID=68238 RepID=A0A918NYJ5_9ACTN|nr:hypothetical protein GCM10010358_69640 [Streptomyces minutiscleroticus]
MLWPLPMCDHGKDIEILALRHRLMVLERRLGKGRAWFAPGDRAFLAALLHRLPRGVLRQVRLRVRPDTVLYRHRDLLARRHADVSLSVSFTPPARARTISSATSPSSMAPAPPAVAAPASISVATSVINCRFPPGS